MLLAHWRWPILVGFAALVVLALALAPRLSFDSDPLDTQSPNSEAMRTLRDLMNQPLSNPYSIDILARNVGEARLLAARLRQLSTVSKVITIESFVPDDQTAKLALIADAADIVAPSSLPPTDTRPANSAEISHRGAVCARADQAGTSLAAAGRPAERHRRRS